MEDELQEEGFGEEKPEAEVKKKKGKKNPLILVVGFVVLVVVAYFIVVGVVKPWLFPEKKVEEGLTQKKVEEPKEKKEFGAVYEIKEITVNVRERNRSRYLIADVVLEFEEKKLPKGVEERDSYTRDVIRGIFGRLTYEKAMDVTYEDTIKAQIKEEVSKILPENAKIRRVLLPKKVAQ